MDEHSELLIQKCVDGELTTDAQRELLSQLDLLVDGWKILALSYVEEQTWSRTFVAANDSAGHQEESPAGKCIVEAGEVTTDKPTVGRSALLTQATCLAIALVGGVLIGDIWQARAVRIGPQVSSPAIPENSQTGGSAAMPSGNSLASAEPYELELPVGSGGSVSVPAYPADTSILDFGPDLRPSDSVSRELRKLGYQFEDRQSFISFELENGERVLLPLQSLRIAPSGQ